MWWGRAETMGVWGGGGVCNGIHIARQGRYCTEAKTTYTFMVYLEKHLGLSDPP